jgi:hypothetical protein
MTQEQMTQDKQSLMIEGKTIIRRWKLDMEELNEINNVSNSELDKIVDELDTIGDDDLEYMGDEEIDDEEINDDAEEEELDDKVGNEKKIAEYI